MNKVLFFFLGIVFIFSPSFLTRYENTYSYDYDDIDSLLEIDILELNNYTLRDVFENTSLFDTYQLVSNGDFNNGTSGWTATTNTTGFAVNSGIMQFEKIGADSYIYELMTISVSKYYMIYRAKSPSNTFNMNLSGTYTLNHSGSDTFEIISQVVDVTSNLTAVRLQTGAVGVNYVDYAYLFNISTLIANKQYSPIYKKTFDVMNNDEIKAQMDEFVAKPYLFLDYETLGLDDLLISNTDMDYWYNLYYDIVNDSVDLDTPSYYWELVFQNNQSQFENITCTWQNSFQEITEVVSSIKGFSNSLYDFISSRQNFIFDYFEYIKKSLAIIGDIFKPRLPWLPASPLY